MIHRSLFRCCRALTVLLLFILPAAIRVSGQEPDSVTRPPESLRAGRLTAVLTGEGVLHFASLAGLYYAWYRDYPQSSFHLFNDAGEWMQVDKCGHGISAYYISRIGHAGYRWSGVPEKQSAWYGGLLGFIYLLNIEVLDGFSAGWGFSAGDLTANTLGCLAFTAQQLAWHEQRLSLKYSFHRTGYSSFRPDQLGRNAVQEMVKDYNGQTYWISANISSFLPRESKFPRWLNVAAGYGAEGMTGATANSGTINGQPLPPFTRYRQFYLSLDADLTRIPVRSKLVRGIFTVLGFIKLPAPALEYNSKGHFVLHPFYF